MELHPRPREHPVRLLRGRGPRAPRHGNRAFPGAAAASDGGESNGQEPGRWRGGGRSWPGWSSRRSGRRWPSELIHGLMGLNSYPPNPYANPSHGLGWVWVGGLHDPCTALHHFPFLKEAQPN